MVQERDADKGASFKQIIKTGVYTYIYIQTSISIRTYDCTIEVVGTSLMNLHGKLMYLYTLFSKITFDLISLVERCCSLIVISEVKQKSA